MVNMVEAFYPVLAEGGVMINFSSVAAYTMPQTDEWSQAFEAWNEPDFYDRLLTLAVFLCSSGAGYINGVDILADGGQNAGIFVPQI